MIICTQNKAETWLQKNTKETFHTWKKKSCGEIGCSMQENAQASSGYSITRLSPVWRICNDAWIILSELRHLLTATVAVVLFVPQAVTGTGEEAEPTYGRQACNPSCKAER